MTGKKQKNDQKKENSKFIEDMNHSSVFGIIIALIIIIVIQFDLSAVATGGIILILGSFYIYIGNVFFSVLMYAGADVCWLINAYSQDDIFGAITVTIGIITGALVARKMHKGEFTKDLKV